MERDIFYRCLDNLIKSRHKQGNQGTGTGITEDCEDFGEREAILEAFKTDLHFCYQYEEQLKLLGFEIPK